MPFERKLSLIMEYVRVCPLEVLVLSDVPTTSSPEDKDKKEN